MNARFPRKQKSEKIDIMKPILKKRVDEQDCYGRLYSPMVRECQACSDKNFCAAQYSQNEILRKKRDMEQACMPKDVEVYDITPDENAKMVSNVIKFSNTKEPISLAEIKYHLTTEVFGFAEPDNLEPSFQEKVDRNTRLFIKHNKDQIFYNEQLQIFQAIK